MILAGKVISILETPLESQGNNSRSTYSTSMLGTGAQFEMSTIVHHDSQKSVLASRLQEEMVLKNLPNWRSK